MPTIFPTKGYLIATKKSLALAKNGYELMDRKRNILVREMMQLIARSKDVRGEIEEIYTYAFKSLQQANMSLGVVYDQAKTVPIENSVDITYRSVMGVEIPNVKIKEQFPQNFYGMNGTNADLDTAFLAFNKAKELTIVLCEVENSVYRLASAIKKTARRANALKNVIIPGFEDTVKYITEVLEEKEREEFSRLKVIKKRKA